MVYPEPTCSKLQNDSAGLQPLAVDCLARIIQEPTIIMAGTGLHALLSYKTGMGNLVPFWFALNLVALPRFMVTLAEGLSYGHVPLL